ncbi:MAG: preprotein translocase subunit YajC [Phycisphaerae bacterium]|nr:preprotein translocase subunit YajC [Phycisphaerae bacterium]
MNAILATMYSLLAQVATSAPATSQPATPTPKASTGGGGGGLFGNPTLLIGIVGAMLLFMLLTGRGRKKQEKAREKMLNELGKNDRVVTIGGLVGVVVDVKDDEIVVKIDESNNTKIRMKKWAVRAQDARESGGEKKEEKK